jgi:hypothetical protein
LNVADPLVAGEYGKAAFDAVGPLLLIGWAEVGPDLLRALTIPRQPSETRPYNAKPVQAVLADEPNAIGQTAPESSGDARPDGRDKQGDRSTSTPVDDDLLERARQEDARHWEAHRRPISADTLRKRLRIGAARSRLLVAIIRADLQRRSAHDDVTRQARILGMIITDSTLTPRVREGHAEQAGRDEHTHTSTMKRRQSQTD